MSLAQKVNVLRASVMGANDGIISIAGIVIGVAAATSNARSILIAGLSGTLAGMISMCMGEYVSVSTQKDSQKMALISEKQRLQNQYQHEFDYVQKKYEAQDIDPQLAKQATKELMEKDSRKVVEMAVKGMLQHNTLGAEQFNKLKVYAGAEHPHAAQKPIVLEKEAK